MGRDFLPHTWAPCRPRRRNGLCGRGQAGFRGLPGVAHDLWASLSTGAEPCGKAGTTARVGGWRLGGNSHPILWAQPSGLPASPPLGYVPISESSSCKMQSGTYFWGRHQPRADVGLGHHTQGRLLPPAPRKPPGAPAYSQPGYLLNLPSRSKMASGPPVLGKLLNLCGRAQGFISFQFPFL